ncbi:MAG: hypothetical protein JO012_16725 [Hyphomicrobiales bacterium]|nr:hypothetical protein [Hyphomicrobiales bacterium]
MTPRRRRPVRRKAAGGYHVLDRAGLYQWGPDLPDDFIDAKLTRGGSSSF